MPEAAPEGARIGLTGPGSLAEPEKACIGLVGNICYHLLLTTHTSGAACVYIVVFIEKRKSSFELGSLLRGHASGTEVTSRGIEHFIRTNAPGPRFNAED